MILTIYSSIDHGLEYNGACHDTLFKSSETISWNCADIKMTPKRRILADLLPLFTLVKGYGTTADKRERNRPVGRKPVSIQEKIW